MIENQYANMLSNQHQKDSPTFQNNYLNHNKSNKCDEFSETESDLESPNDLIASLS